MVQEKQLRAEEADVNGAIENGIFWPVKWNNCGLVNFFLDAHARRRKLVKIGWLRRRRRVEVIPPGPILALD